MKTRLEDILPVEEDAKEDRRDESADPYRRIESPQGAPLTARPGGSTRDAGGGSGRKTAKDTATVRKVPGKRMKRNPERRRENG